MYESRNKEKGDAGAGKDCGQKDKQNAMKHRFSMLDPNADRAQK